MTKAKSAEKATGTWRLEAPDPEPVVLEMDVDPTGGALMMLVPTDVEVEEPPVRVVSTVVPDTLLEETMTVLPSLSVVVKMSLPKVTEPVRVPGMTDGNVSKFPLSL